MFIGNVYIVVLTRKERLLKRAPDLDQDDINVRYFKYLLPLSDQDHGLHHTMKELEGSFDEVQWNRFDECTHTLAKHFSKRDYCDAFSNKFIWNNPRIPGRAKHSLSVLFKSTCPTYYAERWGYMYEVQKWIANRYELFTYLKKPLPRYEFFIPIDCS